MPSRFCRWLFPVAFLALVVGGCGSGSKKPAAAVLNGPGAKAPKGLRGVVVMPPLPKPDIRLTDTSGQQFPLLANTQGMVTLLYFGYTHCPDVCPTHMANIATALRQLPAPVTSKIKVVFVTTDPARDTGPVLRAWLDHFDSSFVGLTGTPAQITAAGATLGMPPSSTENTGNGNYAVDHAAQVDAFTADNLDHVEYPSGYEAKDWVNDLPKLVSGWPKS
jgi:protein SCO1/2